MKKLFIAFLALAFIIPALCLAGRLQDAQRGVIAARGSSSSSSGGANDIYDAQVRFGASTLTGANFKICLISDAGAILATSNSGTFSASSTVTVTFPSAYTLVATTPYRAGLIGDGYFDIGISGGSWDRNTDTTNSYASPTAVDPGGDGNDANGLIAVAIRNSSATVLIGSVGGAGSASTGSGADAMTYWATSEAY